ncbi:MAG: hypothetical protein JWR61_1439 [Ferruginibacter sp.]|nr:hypothetical protein [Ferruginibacter sp.]
MDWMIHCIFTSESNGSAGQKNINSLENRYSNFEETELNHHSEK